jgi:hypothetical protein
MPWSRSWPAELGAGRAAGAGQGLHALHATRRHTPHATRYWLLAGGGWWWLVALASGLATGGQTKPQAPRPSSNQNQNQKTASSWSWSWSWMSLRTQNHNQNLRCVMRYM